MAKTCCSSAQIKVQRIVKIKLFIVCTLHKSVPDKIHRHVSICQMPKWNSSFIIIVKCKVKYTFLTHPIPLTFYKQVTFTSPLYFSKVTPDNILGVYNKWN
jgi:hypothetical protein